MTQVSKSEVAGGRSSKCQRDFVKRKLAPNRMSFERQAMNKIQICFIRMDGSRIDALRVIEMATVAETKEDAFCSASRELWANGFKTLTTADARGQRAARISMSATWLIIWAAQEMQPVRSNNFWRAKESRA